jgi:hypothetical protein
MILVTLPSLCCSLGAIYTLLKVRIGMWGGNNNTELYENKSADLELIKEGTYLNLS